MLLHRDRQADRLAAIVDRRAPPGRRDVQHVDPVDLPAGALPIGHEVERRSVVGFVERDRGRRDPDQLDDLTGRAGPAQVREAMAVQEQVDLEVAPEFVGAGEVVGLVVQQLI